MNYMITKTNYGVILHLKHSQQSYLSEELVYIRTFSPSQMFKLSLYVRLNSLFLVMAELRSFGDLYLAISRPIFGNSTPCQKVVAGSHLLLF